MKLLSSAPNINFTNGTLLQINYFIVFYCCSVREVSREPCTNFSSLRSRHWNLKGVGDQQEEEKGEGFSISRFSPSLSPSPSPPSSLRLPRRLQLLFNSNTRTPPISSSRSACKGHVIRWWTQRCDDPHKLNWLLFQKTPQTSRVFPDVFTCVFIAPHHMDELGRVAWKFCFARLSRVKLQWISLYQCYSVTIKVTYRYTLLRRKM